jgi:hypothetical protein
MVILANKNIPKQALQHLSAFGELLLIQTKGITYPAVAGHPDIFLCQVDDVLVMAPNAPKAFKAQLTKRILHWREGYEDVGYKYPETARYNCVVTDDFLIGNTELIDKKILELSSGKVIIYTKQGYTRCNLLPLEDNRFITSDKGIEKVLVEKGLEVLYANPEGIQLPGFDHGFIGGCCGISGNKVFIIGSLNHYPEGIKMREFLAGYEIIELYDGLLYDAGGLFFIS